MYQQQNGQQNVAQQTMTQEELQRTQVLNLKDFEEVARYERLTSKKPAMMVALAGVLAITIGVSFPFVQSLTARQNAKTPIVEQRIEQEDEAKDDTLECNFFKQVADGTDVTSQAVFKFENNGLVSFVRTTTINPTKGNEKGPETVKSQTNYLQPLLTQINGYKVSVQPTTVGGIKIVTDVEYKLIDLTIFPATHKNHYSTSVDYVINTPKEDVIKDMESYRGFVCKK